MKIEISASVLKILSIGKFSRIHSWHRGKISNFAVAGPFVRCSKLLQSLLKFLNAIEDENLAEHLKLTSFMQILEKQIFFSLLSASNEFMLPHKNLFHVCHCERFCGNLNCCAMLTGF